MLARPSAVVRCSFKLEVAVRLRCWLPGLLKLACERGSFVDEISVTRRQRAGRARSVALAYGVWLLVFTSLGGFCGGQTDQCQREESVRLWTRRRRGQGVKRT